MSCGSDNPPNQTIQKEDTSKKIVKPIDINKINFYFENSLSMNGYLKEEDFRQSIRTILHKIKGDKLNSYFVNSMAIPESNIFDRISKNDIKTLGIGNSDHKFIFTNAINNSTGNNLSIVITDGIYSVNDGDINDVEVDIKAAFEEALKKNAIETVVLKMSSNFKGQYYSESCPKKGGVKINQQRPYYILLFGKKEVINNALKEIVILNDLKGYKEQARFMITKDLKVNYSVLSQGEEKKGEFRSTNRDPIIKEIGNAKKDARSAALLKDRYLQFGIAVDFTNISITESYLSNRSNYSIEDNTGYSIQKIKKIKDLDKNSKTYKLFETQNKGGKFNFTHIITVKGKTKLYGDLNLSLDINFPEWIAKTGSADDCNITKDTSRTFAFDRLIFGISKAYKNTNKKEEYFKIKIKIKAD